MQPRHEAARRQAPARPRVAPDHRGPGGLLKPTSTNRADIPPEYRWDLAAIFEGWEAWQEAYLRLEALIEAFPARKGRLSSGPDELLAAFRASDELGQLAYRVYYYPSLRHDEDQRDNDVSARYQQVQILFARWQQATSWFNPELLAIPLATVREWMDADPGLALYRFAIENLFRQQEHVLDDQGERLLSLASRFVESPSDAYSALSTADAHPPTITLSDGRGLKVTYGEYRSVLATSRVQADRSEAFRAYHQTYEDVRNSYAALYNAVCQRDWFLAQARGYPSTIEAALHGDNIPPAVVDTLIEVAREGAPALQRYHRVRRKALGLATYHLYDGEIPLVDFERRYTYEEAREWVIESAGALGDECQALVRQSFVNRSIDVYENEGKRSGAYSAPVYGVHPYMLLNHNDTLDAVFTLAHEMGHNLHTALAHQHQPFVYSEYTIFVAEVPSTLNEALLLEHLLSRSRDPRERVVLLEHAIDNIAGTFYRQALFADFELQAHRMAERGEPITADALNHIFDGLWRAYYADALDHEPLARVTWARVPHFYATPYYVYQYATCFASAALLVKRLLEGDRRERPQAVEPYLDLLRSGGSDYPMEQLRRAGVDLGDAATIRAVVVQFDGLVDRLERELAALDAMTPSHASAPGTPA